MTRLTTFDVNKLTPHSVGLDRLFDDMFRFVEHTPATNYPPYNIVQNGEQFQIEMALAGVAYEDLDITLANGQLIIAHTPQDIENEDWKYVHKGIAQRKFERKFTLAEDVVVNGARMENGMLYIELERIVPEEKKPRKIEIEYKS
jgi:molecular chaperone IbpA